MARTSRRCAAVADLALRRILHREGARVGATLAMRGNSLAWMGRTVVVARRGSRDAFARPVSSSSRKRSNVRRCAPVAARHENAQPALASLLHQPSFDGTARHGLRRLRLHAASARRHENLYRERFAVEPVLSTIPELITPKVAWQRGRRSPRNCRRRTSRRSSFVSGSFWTGIPCSRTWSRRSARSGSARSRLTRAARATSTRLAAGSRGSSRRRRSCRRG